MSTKSILSAIFFWFVLVTGKAQVPSHVDKKHVLTVGTELMYSIFLANHDHIAYAPKVNYEWVWAEAWSLTAELGYVREHYRQAGKRQGGVCGLSLKRYVMNNLGYTAPAGRYAELGARVYQFNQIVPALGVGYASSQSATGFFFGMGKQYVVFDKLAINTAMRLEYVWGASALFRPSIAIQLGFLP